MKVKITGAPYHNVYGSSGMSGKLGYGFEKLGHTIVQGNKWEAKEDLLIIPGSSANFKDYNTKAKKIFWSHGVHWFNGFDVPQNETLKDNFELCDAIAYQSEFAKHMTQKAFGQKEGPIVLNAAIPNFPETLQIWKEGEEIRIACCAVWRAWKRLHEIERLTRVIASQGQRVKLFVVGRVPEASGLYNLPLHGENYDIEYLGMMNHEKMREIYEQCHLFLQLSFNDYSPATAGEAMAWGLPVIGVNSGGIKDIVEGGGIIIDNDPFVDSEFNINREDILPAIDDNKFLEAFWEMMNNLSYYQTQTKKWVEEEANSIRQAQKLLDFYEQI